MKKVLELITELGDGGAETLVKDYSKILKEDGFDVVVVSLYKFRDSANIRQLNDSSINQRSLLGPYTIWARGLNCVLGKHLVPWRLKQIISQEKPDCIHVHLAMLKYLAPIRDALHGIKLLYTCHSEPNRFLKKGGEEYEAASHLIRHNGMQLIALHEDMREELNNLFGISNTVVIHNGIDMKRFQNVSVNIPEKRKELGIPEDAFVIGHVGRFVHSKNHAFLVDVFQEAYQRNEKAFLLMIGSGEQQASIEEKLIQAGLKDRYLILSARTDIPELLRIMNVFLLPSKFEGLSVSLVEVQSVGLRCIVSDKVNPESILSENTISVEIDNGPAKWVDIIENPSIKNSVYGDIGVFDLRKEMKRLEALYFS